MREKDTDRVLKKEEKEFARLSKKLGKSVVKKLDTLLKRELIWREKAEKIELIKEEKRPPEKKYKVIIAVKGKVKVPKKDAKGRRLSRKARRNFVKKESRKLTGGVVGYLREIKARPVKEHWINNTVVVELTLEQLKKIATRNDVESIIISKKQYVADLDVSVPLMRVPDVWADGYTGQTIDVAITDTGVDNNHPALVGKVIYNEDFTDEGNTNDNHGHGTHVAGTVASQDGVYRGVAPEADLLNLKLMDGNGGSEPAWAINAIERAVDRDADVISASWGWTHRNGFWDCPDGRCVLCTAADNAVQDGVVFSIAAGNEDNDQCGTFDTHIRCPGNAREAVTVGASDDSDNMASFSSIGPTPDGRQKPDVTAPGVDIISCRAAGTDMGNPIDANWTEASGTSMACPHVSGVSAIVLDVGSFPPFEVKQLLMDTAVDIGAGPNEQGGGRVDAKATCDAARAAIGAVAIANIVYDPPGLDRINYVWVNLEQETVEIRNGSNYDIDFSRWVLSDIANHRYVFPDRFILRGGATVTVHTGSGNDTDADLYMNRGAPIWNNNGDTVTLRDNRGRVVTQYNY